MVLSLGVGLQRAPVVEPVERKKDLVIDVAALRARVGGTQDGFARMAMVAQAGVTCVARGGSR
jgi:hypothetical protein